MRTVILIVTFLVLPLSTLAAHAAANTDTAVLNAVIQSLCTDKDLRPPPSKYSVVSSQTYLVYDKTLEEINRHAAKSLQERNTSLHQLSQLESCSTERFIPTVKVDGDFNWDAFFKQYPDSAGVVIFSLPGYSSDHRKALVGGSFRLNSYSAFGVYWVLEESHGRWLVVRKIHSWMT